jgi:hypothetical protein
MVALTRSATVRRKRGLNNVSKNTIHRFWPSQRCTLQVAVKSTLGIPQQAHNIENPVAPFQVTDLRTASSFNTALRCTLAVAAALTARSALAEQPTTKTAAPVIYLAHNLDESAKLGWCFDTVGRGFSQPLHAHSCKPANASQEIHDVQFKFKPDSRQIESAAFVGKCLDLVDAAHAAMPFRLLDCAANIASQQFAFEASTGEFQWKSDRGPCMSVGLTSRQAGPFLSRDLKIENCAKVDAKYKQWVIRP